MSDATAPPLAGQRTVEVLENERIARDTFRLSLADEDTARTIMPGQFLMIRPLPSNVDNTASDPLLGRPFALYDIVRDRNDQPVAIDVVYQILGRGTRLLTGVRPGDLLSIWGPLGNGFDAPPAGGEVYFVAGGIGQTPFLALAKWWLGTTSYGQATTSRVASPARDITLFYGVRTADLAAGVDDFSAAGVCVELATDDGSTGYRGYVTDLLKKKIIEGGRPAMIVGCGPVPMLRALAEITSQHGLEALLSLESPMACGFGACFSCVVPIRQLDGSIDLRRVCVEGPIFPAADVVWD
jgi:dihydroorotate dehydrogenase electron transfer subunit